MTLDEEFAWIVDRLNLDDGEHAPAGLRFNSELKAALTRVWDFRRRRALPDGTVPVAHEDWPEVVQRHYPILWPEPPILIPPGWCDLLLALSATLSDLDDGTVIQKAFMNAIGGGMLISSNGPDRSSGAALWNFQKLSVHICCECGAPGEPSIRRHQWRVLCRSHGGTGP